MFEPDANAIMQVLTCPAVEGQGASVAVHDLSGRKVADSYTDFLRLRHTLQPGVYIVAGRKVMLR